MKTLQLIALLLCTQISGIAQSWYNTGLVGNHVFEIIHYSDDILLAATYSGVYYSEDDGTSWSLLGMDGTHVNTVFVVDTVILVGTEHYGLYWNDNLDTTFVKMESENYNVFAIRENNDTIYASTLGLNETYRYSIDNGLTWTSVLTNPQTTFLELVFDTLGRAFAATPYRCYYSDNMIDWTSTNGPGNGYLDVSILNGDTLLYGSYDGLFLSVDRGVSMQEITGYIQSPYQFVIGDSVFNNHNNKLNYTMDINSPFSEAGLSESVTTLKKHKDKLIAGTYNSGIYVKSLINNIEKPGLRTANIYPNPASEFIQIEAGLDEVESVEVYNEHGALVCRGEGSRIDVEALAPGVYYCRITTLKNTRYQASFVKI